jgi:hypothetical protein
MSKARLLSDSDEKAALLRSILDKSVRITDSRARSIAHDAVAMLAKIDSNATSLVQYYDEFSGMPEEQRDEIRALEKKISLLDDPDEKIRVYDEVINRDIGGKDKDSRVVAAAAMVGKAELIDAQDEKISLYDMVLFEMTDICSRYFYSRTLQERVALAGDESEKYGLVQQYTVVRGDTMEPDTKMLLLLDEIIVAHNAGFTDYALRSCDDVISFCDEYLDSDENGNEISPVKDVKRTSIMDSMGKAILAKAVRTMANGKRASNEEMLKLYNKYLAYSKLGHPYFISAITENIHEKRAGLP